MTQNEEALAKACCADLYQSPLARQILGDPPHPGGLAVTSRLGAADGHLRRGLGVGPGQRPGHQRHGPLPGLSLQRGGPGIRHRASGPGPRRRDGAAHNRQGFFLRGDAESPPLMGGSFDGVVCKCSMSLFADKQAAVAQAVRVLKPGGRIGFSDMTVEPGALPEELQGYIGQVLCLARL